MHGLVVFEDAEVRNLLPLTWWRTASELRTGYRCLLNYILRTTGFAPDGPPVNGSPPRTDISLYCRDWLAEVTAERFACRVNTPPPGDRCLFVNARLLMTEPPADQLEPGVQWYGDSAVIIVADQPLVARLTPDIMLDPARLRDLLSHLPERCYVRKPHLMGYPWDLVQANQDMLRWGWAQLGRPADLAGRICSGAHILDQGSVYVGAGSVIKPGVVLDAESGPIYIGENVTVSPNVSIEGPCYIGTGSLIQPGAVLRDGMSIGQRCKVGGELESSIIHGFSNKQHDGFLGHSYVAEWVNLAADTVNSDLKNTYGSIHVFINGVEVDSGQMFVGLTIGDHSKTGIGQMFPTGAVVAFGCNIATCTFSSKFVPSFTWLTASGTCNYDVDRCLEVARRVMERRQMAMTAAQERLFRRLPALAAETEGPASSARPGGPGPESPPVSA